EIRDYLLLHGRQGRGVGTADQQRVVREQRLLVRWRAVREIFAGLDVLAGELVRRGPEQARKPDGRVLAECAADELVLPLRLVVRRRDVPELFGGLDALQVVLVRGGQEQAREPDGRVLVECAADELVLPPRLALDVQHVPPLARHLYRTILRVVDEIALAGEGGQREAQIADAGLADVDVHGPGRDARTRRQADRLRRDDRVAVVDAQVDVRGARVADADLGADRRPREPARGQDHVLERDVLRKALAADADGVHGNAVARDLGDARRVELVRVVAAVADEHDRAERARLRGTQHGQERIADPRPLAGRRHLVQGRQLDELRVEREKLDGKIGGQRRQRVLTERGDRLLQTRALPFAVAHARRRIEQHGNRVLLR